VLSINVQDIEVVNNASRHSLVDGIDDLLFELVFFLLIGLTGTASKTLALLDRRGNGIYFVSVNYSATQSNVLFMKRVK
jgi:hypothetical protein